MEEEGKERLQKPEVGDNFKETVFSRGKREDKMQTHNSCESLYQAYASSIQTKSQHKVGRGEHISKPPVEKLLVFNSCWKSESRVVIICSLCFILGFSEVTPGGLMKHKNRIQS